MAIVRNRAEHILDLTGGNWIAPAEEKNIDTSPDHEQDLLAQGVLVLVGPETAPAQPATHWPPAYHPYDDNYAGHTWDRFIKSDNEDLSEMDDQLLGLTDRLEQLFIAPLRLDQVPLPAASVNMNGQRLVGLGSPTAAADAATKSYVDAVSQGLDVKAAVRASTTAPITLSGTQTIDGVAVIAGDRVLVKNQGTPTENGIYEVAAGAWTRTTDADTSAELHTGIFTFVQEGTVNASTGWVVSTTGLISIGSTAIVFTQFSGTGQITAGGGLVKSGAVLDVVAGPGIQVDADAVRIAPDAGRVAASDGLVTKAKAGAIVDGDFTATPVNGLIGVNTSSNELVYRSGGQWYGLQTSVVNAKHEGADPTFVADSTTALRNAWTKYLAGSYSAFVIPPGNYKIDPGTTTPMFEATGKKGIRVEASGATLNDVHDYSAGGIGHLFKLFGCDDTYINLNVVSTINPAAPYNNGDRGLRVVTCQANGTYGGQGLDLIGRHEGCLWSFSAVKLGADVDSMKFRNVRIKIQTYNTFYPLSFQFSGDNVYAEADIERCGRAYFPYGIKNHEIHINVKNQRLQSVIGGGGVVSLDSPYCGCENIELHYRDRDSDTGTLYGSSGQGVVLLWRWDAGNPGAVTHKNINFYMDTKANLGSGFWSVLTGVQFRKQIATTSADDTTPRGHTLDGCRIFGTMDGDFGGAAAVIDNFNNTVVVGDPNLNCVCEARISGLVNPNFPPGWIRRFSGTGSPETVVAAPPGSTFNRTDGGANTSFYVKGSGVGKTGWYAIADDRIVRPNVVWDNVTDDTAAVQSAINAANAAGGGIVELPHGTGYIAGSLTHYPKVWLRGQGQGATTIRASDLTAAAVISAVGTLGGNRALTADASDSDTSVTIASGGIAALGLAADQWIFLQGDTVGVQDGSFTTRILSVSAGGGVAGGDLVTLEEPLPIVALVANAAKLYVATGLLDSPSVSDLRIHVDYTGAAVRQRHVQFTNTIEPVCERVLMTATGTGPAAGNSGVLLTVSRGGSITECRLDGITGANSQPLYVQYVTGAEISGNKVHNCGGGATISQSPLTVFEGNRTTGRSSGGGRGCKFLAGSNYSTITGNVIWGVQQTGLTGIQCDDSYGLTITGNVFGMIAGSGIVVSGTTAGRCHHCTVTGNVVAHAMLGAGTAAIVLNAGTGGATVSGYHTVADNEVYAIRGASGVGIYALCSDNTITGNTVHDTDSYGIITNGDRSLISNNTFRNNAILNGQAISTSGSTNGRNIVGPNNLNGQVCAYTITKDIVHQAVLLGDVAYSNSITPDADVRTQQITVTNGTAFQINQQTSRCRGQRLRIVVFNNSGGAHGQINMPASYTLAGGGTILWAAATIANAKRRWVDFENFDGTNWVETGRASGDF